MPARKTRAPAEAEAETVLEPEAPSAPEAAAGPAAATLDEAAPGAAEVARGAEEAAAAITYSELSDAAARRAARDAAEGAAALSIADEVAAGGALAAALSSDEFRRGMELAGIAGQVQVAAELLVGAQQPMLSAFMGGISRQLHVLAVGALGRATAGAVAAHGAEHLAGELATLGLTEMGEGRDEYEASAALGAASAEMAAAAIRSATDAAELAAARALDGVNQALANDPAGRAAETRGAPEGSPSGVAATATPKVAAKPAPVAAAGRAPRKPAKAARPKK